MEDLIWWRASLMTFDGRWPLMEDDFWWKMTYDRRWLLMEDDFWWKTTFNWRRPPIEDDRQWKTTFIGEILRFRSAIYHRCGNFFQGSIFIKSKHMFIHFTVIYDLWIMCPFNPPPLCINNLSFCQKKKMLFCNNWFYLSIKVNQNKFNRKDQK